MFIVLVYLTDGSIKRHRMDSYPKYDDILALGYKDEEVDCYDTHF